MDEENKKKLQIVVIIAIILFVIIGILTLILKSNKNEDKIFNAKDYIIEKETKYTEKGLMPIINLKGEEIEKINSEIMTKYYSTVHNEYDEFKYEYEVYKNILSMLITVTYSSESEYGTIEYYAYNINLEKNKVLTNKELYEYLELDSNEIKNKIDLKYKDLYNNDELKNEISYEEYLEIINYKEENDKVVIKDKTLYKYNVLNLTQSLMTYSGNINEVKLIELK